MFPGRRRYTPAMRVDVALLPPADPPARQTCLVVDVLRATSVMAVLLGRGVEAIYPAASVDAARALRDRLAETGPVLLCGEVDSLPPPGFDFGNSPSEFAGLPDLPARRAVIATTNGTPALHACAAAPLTVAAAPLNAAAAVALALAAGRDVLVVCSGTGGAPSEDDRLAAGLLADRLATAGAAPGDEAARAIADFRAVRDDLAAALGATRHGARLVAQGFGDDIAFCAQTDRCARAGVLAIEHGLAMLRPATPGGGRDR